MKFVVLLFCGLIISASCLAQKRYALVIGNQAYDSLPYSYTHTFDADLISRGLEHSGFEVILGEDLTHKEMIRLFFSFNEKISLDSCIALIFYSGYVFSSGKEMYLAGVDYPKSKEFSANNSMQLTKMISALQNSMSQKNFIIIDTVKSLTKKTSKSSRTQQMPSYLRKVENSFIILSGNSPEQVSANTSKNSLFCQAFYDAMLTPGLPVSKMESTLKSNLKDFADQMPGIHSTLSSDFVFLSFVKQTEDPIDLELTRGGHLSSRNSSQANELNLKYYALIVGTSQYRNNPPWRQLPNPILDAENVAKELHDSYNFDTIFLRNPTKNELLSKLRSLSTRSQTDNNSSILIFIAGHGGFDEVSDGFIVPTDGKDPKLDTFQESFVPHSVLKSWLEKFANKHVLLLLDVCFGGTFDANLTRRSLDNDPYEPVTDQELIRRKLEYRSKLYITSGGKEYVSDGVKGRHSPFCARFLKLLRESAFRKQIITYDRLKVEFDTLKPETHPGFFGDHQPGGDFILIPKQFFTQKRK